jgi:hypothetical protein
MAIIDELYNTRTISRTCAERSEPTIFPTSGKRFDAMVEAGAEAIKLLAFQRYNTTFKYPFNKDMAEACLTAALGKEG